MSAQLTNNSTFWGPVTLKSKFYRGTWRSGLLGQDRLGDPYYITYKHIHVAFFKTVLDIGFKTKTYIKLGMNTTYPPGPWDNPVSEPKRNYGRTCSWSLMSSFHLASGRTREEQRQSFENSVNSMIGSCPFTYYVKQQILRRVRRIKRIWWNKEASLKMKFNYHFGKWIVWTDSKGFRRS